MFASSVRTCIVSISIVISCLFACDASPANDLRQRASKGDMDAVLLVVEELTDRAPRYHPEAEKWLRYALDKGNHRAVRPLAEMLLLREDDVGLYEAVKLLRPLGARDSMVQARVGRAFLERGYVQEGVGWLQAAALNGNFDAAVKVSQTYKSVDDDLSVFWACRALSIRNDKSFIAEELRSHVLSSGRKCAEKR